MDCGSRNDIQTNEKINSGNAYVNCTKRERTINHLPGSCKRSHQCSPNDKKGRESNAHLFRQSCITGSGNQLHSDGKADTCLKENDIHYRPRTSVKGQFLADFIVERPKDDPQDTPMEDDEALPDPCILFTDRSLYIDGSGAGLIIKNPDGLEFTYALSFAYLSKQVLVEELKEKSIDEKEVLAVVEEERCTWMTPIHEYLTKEILLEEKRKARAIRRKARRYDVTNGSCIKGEKISDNGKQFRDNPFKDWCEKLCIRKCFASVKHPQAKSLVERENKGEKQKLDRRYFTLEIGMPTLRTAEVDMIKNDKALEINLDLLEERREQAAMLEAKSKAMMEKYYNDRVRNQVSSRETSSTRAMRQAMRKMKASSDPSRKDHMRSQKH
ncbi:reverse transcriptase domain-containing protein [Tanacetum coccineum]